MDIMEKAGLDSELWMARITPKGFESRIMRFLSFCGHGMCASAFFKRGTMVSWRRRVARISKTRQNRILAAYVPFALMCLQNKLRRLSWELLFRNDTQPVAWRSLVSTCIVDVDSQILSERLSVQENVLPRSLVFSSILRPDICELCCFDIVQSWSHRLAWPLWNLHPSNFSEIRLSEDHVALPSCVLQEYRVTGSMAAL
jgi:hypothetical protein